jgi:hypothetical protein
MKIKITKEEADAIEAVKAAIKNLPRGIQLTVDDIDGFAEFWKQTGPGSWNPISRLWCKRVLSIV